MGNASRMMNLNKKRKMEIVSRKGKRDLVVCEHAKSFKVVSCMNKLEAVRGSKRKFVAGAAGNNLKNRKSVTFHRQVIFQEHDIPYVKIFRSSHPKPNTSSVKISQEVEGSREATPNQPPRPTQ
ncbi:uncharacterized protein G2W53_017973 [Senna tora]|uniref:Uncharacterized protein n=1 Tax=Senna tora TaxID=362788 RepID=A0A834TS80_9FABA|nr:uncharacterized protein G2W53_017973 [Senna tora]